MSPLDEGPEQRWRRTVDRRNKPAKLKVDRLLRDFGYADLDPDAGDAIEARLDGVSLAVTPSLRDAAAGEVVTIYATDSAPPGEARPAAQAGVSPPVPAEEPAVATDVAQMVRYLKQQVLDARAEAERLRGELDRRITTRMDSEREFEAIIAEQAAALQEQSRQLAELGAALNSTRQALSETREEIRRAVGELQALPEPVAGNRDPPPFFDEHGPAPLGVAEAGRAVEESDDEFDLGDLGPAHEREAAEAARGESELGASELPADEEDDVSVPTRAPAEADAPGLDAPGLDAPGLTLDEPVLDLDEPVLDLDGPVLDLDGPVLDLDGPVLDLDEPVLDLDEPALDLDEPALSLDEPALGLDEPALSLDEPALGLDEPALSELGTWQPDGPASPGASAPGLAPLRDFDEPEQAGPLPHSADERSADLDSPLPPSTDWLPADLRPQAGEDEQPAAAAEPSPAAAVPESDEDDLTDFDDFLYDAEELYDPDQAAIGDEPLAPGEDPPSPDQPTRALPAPPPPPPSPWAEDPGPPEPVVVERATLGKALRGRGGRGRWQGSCSICGREPAVNKRKDLQAAGWDLDDDAAACPQCRGLG